MAGPGVVGTRAAESTTAAPGSEAEDETGAPASRASGAESPGGGRSRRFTVLVVAGLSAAVVVPMLIALVALREPRWLPLSDVAQIELRVRDVGLEHPPLLGLGGRLRGYGTTGSHPGPLSFYALAPVYRALGSDGWALQVATATLSVAAAGLVIWMGFRRGGWRFALAVTAMVVLVARAYEAWRLAEAWNPYLPIMWWLVFLLAVWSVLCSDHAMLPVAAFAGTYCAQTHIPYVVLVVGLGGAAAAFLLVQGRRWRREPARWRPLRRWTTVGVGLLALLWLPPVIEQVTNTPGNFAILLENFRKPYDTQVPFDAALTSWFAHLDVRQLWTTDLRDDGSRIPGALLLAVWGLSVVVAWRRRESALLRLHGVVGLALALGLLATSRIFGPLWSYLTLWAWGTTGLLLLATTWTFLTWGPRVGGAPPPAPLTLPAPRWPAPTVALVGLGTVGLATLFAWEAADSRMAGDVLSRGLIEMSAATRAALDEDPADCGDDCEYLVTWNDPFDFSAHGYGMLAELERRGYAARALPSERRSVRPHRVIERDEADAEVHLAAGAVAIEEARAQAGSRELAYIDPNTSTERIAYRQLRRELVAQLEAEGYDELAERAEESIDGMVQSAPGMSPRLNRLIFIDTSFERPSAVFLLEP